MNNTSWLKTLSIGFAIISFGITIAIIGYVVLTSKQNQTPNQQQNISPTIPQLSPTTDETTNWKTYTNLQYGFEFEYPNNLSLREKKGDGVVIRLIPPPLSQYDYLIVFSISKNYDKLDLDQFIVKKFSYYDSKILSYTNTITINKIQGRSLLNTGYACIDICDFFILTNKALFAEITLIKSSGAEIPIKTFDQILSTFRFIE